MPKISPLLEGADYAAAYFADGKFHTIVKRGDRVDRDKHHTEADALTFIGLAGGSPDRSYTPPADEHYVRPIHTEESQA